MCFPGRADGQVQHLVNTAFIGNQVSCHELLAGSVQFMRKTNVKHFGLACVGVKADAVLIRDRDQHEIKQLLQAG